MTPRPTILPRSWLLRGGLSLLVSASALNCGGEPAAAPAAGQPTPAPAAAPAPAPAPADPAAVQPAPAPEAPPEVAAPPTEAAPAGLVSGRYGCSFRDSTGSYNRRCTVSEDGQGGLRLEAPGTELNPNNGFSGTLTGGPDSYRFAGKISGFDNCTGSFDADFSRDGDAYVTSTKLGSGCPISIRLRAPEQAGEEPVAEMGEPNELPATGFQGLAVGKHRCSFTDSTGSYNRVCTITQQGSALELRAPGTKLNPDNGFSGTLSGGPDSYRFSGKVSGFNNCVGPLSADASVKGEAYVAKAKLASGCAVTLKITAKVM